MIGGTVIDTVVLDDRVWINCREKSGTQTCAIFVTNTAKSRTVSEGDALWWQGKFALWTPACNLRRAGIKAGADYDIKLDRIGGSGVARPNKKQE